MADTAAMLGETTAACLTFCPQNVMTVSKVSHNTVGLFPYTALSGTGSQVRHQMVTGQLHCPTALPPSEEKMSLPEMEPWIVQAVA